MQLFQTKGWGAGRSPGINLHITEEIDKFLQKQNKKPYNK